MQKKEDIERYWCLASGEGLTALCTLLDSGHVLSWYKLETMTVGLLYDSVVGSYSCPLIPFYISFDFGLYR